MSFLKIIGISFLVLLVVAGVSVSFFALSSNAFSSQSLLRQALQNPFQATLLVIMIFSIILFIVFFVMGSKNEEETDEEDDETDEEDNILEQLQPEKPMVIVTYPAVDFQQESPTVNFQPEESSTVGEMYDYLASSPARKNEPEFKRFLKNAILELEREKARIYSEVSLLDGDYRKGIITEGEFLAGTELLLGDKGLEEVIEEKDKQIDEFKTKLMELGFRKKARTAEPSPGKAAS